MARTANDTQRWDSQQLLGCNNRGGGGNFSKVKRLVANDTQRWDWQQLQLRWHAHVCGRMQPRHGRLTRFDVTATHCNTFERNSTHCNTTATHCHALQHTATHGNTLLHTATHGNTLQETRKTNTNWYVKERGKRERDHKHTGEPSGVMLPGISRVVDAIRRGEATGEHIGVSTEYVRHASVIRVAWLIHMCNVTHPCAWRKRLIGSFPPRTSYEIQSGEDA